MTDVTPAIRQLSRSDNTLVIIFGIKEFNLAALSKVPFLSRTASSLDQVGKTRATLWEIHPILKIEVWSGNRWRELP